jgi:parallel beta-helix repeat protein
MSDLLIRDNVFEDNFCGGLSIFGSSETVIERNLIKGNRGTGIDLGMSDPQLDNNVIIENRTGGNGGGIVCFGGGEWHNNVIADNWAGGSGSAIYFKSAGSADLVHTTIARNHCGDGSAIYVTHGPFPMASHVTLINTVFVSHTVAISVTADHSVDVQRVLWDRTPVTSVVAPGGSLTISGELTGDPAFAPDGYHLTPWSAAIDEGLATGVDWDVDGQARPEGGAPDLGADEAWWQGVWLPAVLRR